MKRTLQASRPGSVHAGRPHSKRRPVGRAIAWLAGLSLVAGPAIAQFNPWVNPGAGNWFAPENWYFGAPQAGSAVSIDNGGLALISSAGAQAAWLVLGSGGGQGQLAAFGAGTLTVDSWLDVDRGTMQVLSGARVWVLDSARPNVYASAEIGRVGPGALVVSGAPRVLPTFHQPGGGQVRRRRGRHHHGGQRRTGRQPERGTEPQQRHRQRRECRVGGRRRDRSPLQRHAHRGRPRQPEHRRCFGIVRRHYRRSPAPGRRSNSGLRPVLCSSVRQAQAP